VGLDAAAAGVGMVLGQAGRSPPRDVEAPEAMPAGFGVGFISMKGLGVC
jgi:hypothetical protein